MSVRAVERPGFTHFNLNHNILYIYSTYLSYLFSSKDVKGKKNDILFNRKVKTDAVESHISFIYLGKN